MPNFSTKTTWEEVQNKSDEIDFSDSPELTGEFMASAQCELPTIRLEIELDALA